MTRTATEHVKLRDTPPGDIDGEANLTDGVIAECRSIGTQFLEAMTRAHRATSRATNVAFLPLGIMTITFTGKYAMPCKELPIEDIRAAIVEDPRMADTFHLELVRGATTVKRRRKDAFVRDIAHDKRRFRNQLTLSYRGKSAKLFYNGSLHVTGCTSALDMAEIGSRVADLVEVYTDRRIHITLDSMNVRMINAGSVVVDPATQRPLVFAPRALSHAIASLAVAVDFDPERHPGVKLPIQHDGQRVATACVFQTGSVSIIGAREPRAMAMAFETVVHALDRCSVIGEASREMRTTTAKKPFELVRGYPAAMFWACSS